MAQNRLTRIDFDAVNFLRYRFHHGVFRQVDGGDKYSRPLVKGVILLTIFCHELTLLSVPR